MVKNLHFGQKFILTFFAFGILSLFVKTRFGHFIIVLDLNFKAAIISVRSSVVDSIEEFVELELLVEHSDDTISSQIKLI